MDYMDILQLILEVVTALITMIPLVIALVKSISKNAKEKNWVALVNATIELIMQAETEYESGAERKEWVMSMVKKAAVLINYDLTDESVEQVAALIDKLVDMTRHVNVAG